MAIITSAGLTDLYNQRTFNKNGSTVTLKKISETEWFLFGDLAEGDSEGFGNPPLFCESQPSWDQAGVAFGVRMGEPFWADGDYPLYINAFFAYDSTSTRQQTGGFTTIPPEGVDWMLMGWNGDGGLVVGIKPLDGFPIVSTGMEVQIELSTDEGVISMEAWRETEDHHYYGADYERHVEYAPNKTVCVQMLASSNPWFMVYSDQSGQGVLFDGDAGIEGIELSTQVDTTRSVFFRPQDGVVFPPRSGDWLRFDLRDDNWDHPGNPMVLRYGDGTEDTYSMDSSFNFSGITSKGGLVEIEIMLLQSSIPITGELYRLNWSAPF